MPVHYECVVSLVAGDSSDEDAAAPQQIIFCSRTHSQLTQVVGELNRTSFGGAEGTVNAVAVAGRQQLCINPVSVRGHVQGLGSRV